MLRPSARSDAAHRCATSSLAREGATSQLTPTATTAAVRMAPRMPATSTAQNSASGVCCPSRNSIPATTAVSVPSSCVRGARDARAAATSASAAAAAAERVPWYAGDSGGATALHSVTRAPASSAAAQAGPATRQVPMSRVPRWLSGAALSSSTTEKTAARQLSGCATALASVGALDASTATTSCRDTWRRGDAMAARVRRCATRGPPKCESVRRRKRGGALSACCERCPCRPYGSIRCSVHP
ncbi:MAG: hypothetical protein J3K34DRAFT_430257 [Monoraphidium minutum]|nr:MAG: hypothetical protein J3K34DRAFT_430257 [Monoraphidium minutum]